jgi:hypothetical protein
VNQQDGNVGLSDDLLGLRRGPSHPASARCSRALAAIRHTQLFPGGCLPVHAAGLLHHRCYGAGE